MSIIITWETVSEKKTAENLAKQLNLPISSLTDFNKMSFVKPPIELRVSTERIELIVKDRGGDEHEHHLFAEFNKGPLFYRVKKGLGKNEDIAKACGFKKIKGRINIIDATAGLGQDAFVLAALGAHVELIERSPIIMSLLMDGLERAKTNIEIMPIVTQNMSLRFGDATTLLENLTPGNFPDVIYIDPMFNRGKKSALNKIEMRLIREVVGEDRDADRLLPISLKRAKKRVVVKRLRYAKSLLGPAPHFVVKGSSCRYDVYLTDNAVSQDREVNDE